MHLCFCFLFCLAILEGALMADSTKMPRSLPVRAGQIIATKPEKGNSPQVVVIVRESSQKGLIELKFRN